jgi:hypothetical protein
MSLRFTLGESYSRSFVPVTSGVNGIAGSLSRTNSASFAGAVRYFFF